MFGNVVGAIIGGLVLLSAIVLIMTFLLSNYMISKILCFVSGGVAIGLGAKAASIISAAPTMWDTENVEWAVFMIWAVVLSAACWLFFIGPTVLDEEWDGTFTIHSTLTGYEVSPNMSGGLIGNGLGALLVFAFGYFLISDEFGWPAIMVVAPIVIMTFNLLGLLRSIIANR